MSNRITSSLDKKLVDRYPLTVLFRYAVTVPALLMVLLIGVVATIFASPDRELVAASIALPQTQARAYSALLYRVETSCGENPKKPSKKCVPTDPTSKRAIYTMRNIVETSNLQSCTTEKQLTRVDKSIDFEFCAGRPEVSQYIVLLWIALLVISVPAAFIAFLQAAQARYSIPKYHKDLWITPFIFLLFAAAFVPLIASVSVFWYSVRGDVPRSGFRTNEFAASAVALAMIMTSIAVTDLKTYRSVRRYAQFAGQLLGALVIASVVFVISLILVDQFESASTATTAALIMSALVLASALLTLLFSKKFQFERRAFAVFLFRAFRLSWPAIAALGCALASRPVDLHLGPVDLCDLAYVLVLACIPVSRRIELVAF